MVPTPYANRLFVRAMGTRFGRFVYWIKDLCWERSAVGLFIYSIGAIQDLCVFARRRSTHVGQLHTARASSLFRSSRLYRGASCCGLASLLALARIARCSESVRRFFVFLLRISPLSTLLTVPSHEMTTRGTLPRHFLIALGALVFLPTQGPQTDSATLGAIASLILLYGRYLGGQA